MLFRSGASSAWVRRRYPQVFDAALAQSPPVTALVGFPEYDTSNLVALSSPDARCAQEMARVAGALDRLHYEADPCCRYDPERKLWVYLHGDRSVESFAKSPTPTTG